MLITDQARSKAYGSNYKGLSFWEEVWTGFFAGKNVIDAFGEKDKEAVLPVSLPQAQKPSQ